MLFCPMNPSNQTNHITDGSYRLNGWSQVVPICMPWAIPTVATSPQIDVSTQCRAEPVVHFSANRDVNPLLVSSLSQNPSPTVGPTNHMALKDQALCPDPCTSQTATRWELLHNLSTGRQSANQHLKRRNDSSDEELDDELRTTPVKQHISEDKVSAIFNKLHITNDNDLNFEDAIESEELDDQSSDSNEGRQQNPVIFADELQNVIRSKSMTDKVVQNELDRHSKALVLWQPLHPILSANFNSNSDKIADESESNSDENETNDDNLCDLDIEFIGDEEPIDFDNDMELCP